MADLQGGLNNTVWAGAGRRAEGDAQNKQFSLYKILYNRAMKPVEFIGTALDDLRAFPESARGGVSN